KLGNFLHDVDWSPEGHYFAAATSDPSRLVIWNTETWRDPVTFPDHHQRVNRLSWHPTRPWIATASHDGAARIWHAESGSLLSLYAASKDGEFVTLADGKQGRRVEPEVVHLTGSRPAISWAVSWSPTGNRLAWASGENLFVAKIGNAAAHVSLRSIVGNTTFTRSIDWSPDGDRIASGSDDGVVRIWDAATGRCCLEINERAGAVYALRWSPDGTRIAAARGDGTVRIWDATLGFRRESAR
ncbi:MAG: hypothetical protein AAF488_13820, partial [Planctomycetota bacterium]